MEPLLAFLKPYLGGLASEVSLHLLGNVGKCILDKDGWKTDSALPGACELLNLLPSIPPGVNTNFWAAQHQQSQMPLMCYALPLDSASISPGQILKLLLNGLLKFGDRQKDGQRKWQKNHHYDNNCLRFPSAMPPCIFLSFGKFNFKGNKAS